MWRVEWDWWCNEWINEESEPEDSEINFADVWSTSSILPRWLAQFCCLCNQAFDCQMWLFQVFFPLQPFCMFLVTFQLSVRKLLKHSQDPFIWWKENFVRRSISPIVSPMFWNGRRKKKPKPCLLQQFPQHPQRQMSEGACHLCWSFSN